MYVSCYLYLYTYNIYYLSNNVWHLKSFPASTDIKYIKTLPEAQRTQDIESKNWIISKKKLSKLRGIRQEIIGEIIWEKMLVKNWQIYSDSDSDSDLYK